MNGVINLKKCKMVFEKMSLRVVVPLDPAEVSCYTKPVCNYNNDDDLDCSYKINIVGFNPVQKLPAYEFLNK